MAKKKENEEKLKVEIMARIASEDVSGGIDVSYQNAARLAGLVVSANLKLRSNLAAIDEAIRISEEIKFIENHNKNSIDELGLQVLPVT